MSMCCLCTRSVLSVLLWPLVVYHELIQRMYTGLEPILMKLDYSMKGDTEHRKHDKRSECYCDLDIGLTRVHFVKTHTCLLLKYSAVTCKEEVLLLSFESM